MKKIVLWSSMGSLVFVGVILTYVYFALPLVWPVVYSDLRHFDLRGKMYYFTKIQPLKKEAARLEKKVKKILPPIRSYMKSTGCVLTREILNALPSACKPCAVF